MSERNVSIKGQGRMVSVKGLSKKEALDLKTALDGEGVIDVLLAVGQVNGLSPAHQKLASLLSGQPE